MTKVDTNIPLVLIAVFLSVTATLLVNKQLKTPKTATPIENPVENNVPSVSVIELPASDMSYPSLHNTTVAEQDFYEQVPTSSNTFSDQFEAMKLNLETPAGQNDSQPFSNDEMGQGTPNSASSHYPHIHSLSEPHRTQKRVQKTEIESAGVYQVVNLENLTTLQTCTHACFEYLT